VLDLTRHADALHAAVLSKAADAAGLGRGDIGEAAPSPSPKPPRTVAYLHVDQIA
jgi:hypothetical protein